MVCAGAEAGGRAQWRCARHARGVRGCVLAACVSRWHLAGISLADGRLTAVASHAARRTSDCSSVFLTTRPVACEGTLGSPGAPAAAPDAVVAKSSQSAHVRRHRLRLRRSGAAAGASGAPKALHERFNGVPNAPNGEDSQMKAR